MNPPHDRDRHDMGTPPPPPVPQEKVRMEHVEGSKRDVGETGARGL